jgi:hypothetical protein
MKQKYAQYVIQLCFWKLKVCMGSVFDSQEQRGTDSLFKIYII